MAPKLIDSFSYINTYKQPVYIVSQQMGKKKIFCYFLLDSAYYFPILPTGGK